MTDPYIAPSRDRPDTHQRGQDKVSRIPVKVEATTELPRKPAWIRARAPTGAGVSRIRKILRERKLSSVCEEAMCPNLGECFSHGTATFMIMGDICTRRCPFCDVAHGRPQPLDADEPHQLAEAIAEMALKYVVVTSVDRDDLRDGGAAAFRRVHPGGPRAVPADHDRDPGAGLPRPDGDCPGGSSGRPHRTSSTTTWRLCRACIARPGPAPTTSGHSSCCERFKQRHPQVPTKSGLMLGLGETRDEVEAVMRDLRGHGCEMLTLGQYLQPSREHLPVARFVTPEEFDELRRVGEPMGFSNVASGPMVRSSYHADLQANPVLGEE